jgi:histidine ammonia-lyase
MGPIAARKAIEVLRNVERIVAIELLCAAQGADFRGAEKLGKETKAVYSVIRRRVSMLKKDRPLFKDVETVVDMMQKGQINKVVKAFVKE